MKFYRWSFLFVLVFTLSILTVSVPKTESKVIGNQPEMHLSVLTKQPLLKKKNTVKQNTDFYFSADKYPVSLTLKGQQIPIQTVHTDSQGRMDVIDNPGILGWFDTRGYHVKNMLISGHRDWNGDAGVLYGMEDWHGTEITVEFNDGSSENFTLTKVEVFSKTKVPSRIMSLTNGQKHLTMITCVGNFIRDKGGYQSRVVATFLPNH